LKRLLMTSVVTWCIWSFTIFCVGLKIFRGFENECPRKKACAESIENYPERWPSYGAAEHWCRKRRCRGCNRTPKLSDLV